MNKFKYSILKKTRISLFKWNSVNNCVLSIGNIHLQRTYVSIQENKKDAIILNPNRELKDSIATNVVYFNKLNGLFDELKTSLVELKWAKESDLNLNENKIDLITKFNQNNPKLVNIVNKKIKNRNEFNEVVNYFSSNLNELKPSELSKLFRLLNIIENQPKENNLILNIEKLFYSLFQTAASEDQTDTNIKQKDGLNLQDFINFYHGFYKLRYKSNHSLDLMHFYSTSTQHFNQLLIDLLANESVMTNDEQVKQILDGIDCFNHTMTKEVFGDSILRTLENCKSQKNIAYIRDLMDKTENSVKNQLIDKKVFKLINEKIFMVNEKKYLHEWMFNYHKFIKSYFPLIFIQKEKDEIKRFKKIDKEIINILELFLDSKNYSDASNISEFILYLSGQKYKENFNYAMKSFIEIDSFKAKMKNMILKSDFLSLNNLFSSNQSFYYGYYETLDIDTLELKKVIEILKNNEIHGENHLKLIFEISVCFPKIFDSNVAKELNNKNSKYFVLYSLINENYFYENSAIVLNALENNINSFNLYDIKFISERCLKLFEKVDKRIQNQDSTNLIIQKLIDLILPKTSECLLLKNYKFNENEFETDSKKKEKFNFKLYDIDYRFSLISKILNEILSINVGYFNTKLDLNFNEFNQVSDNYVKMFDYLKINYENKSYLNDPAYIQVKFIFESFLDHIRYLSILELLVKSTNKFDPLFGLQLLEIFNKLSRILLDPFFSQLTLRYKSDDYTNFKLMFFKSLRLFNNVNINDIRNNLIDKNKFDIELKQTHKNLDFLLNNLKSDYKQNMEINTLFLNMNHLNEKFIKNTLNYCKKVSCFKKF